MTVSLLSQTVLIGGEQYQVSTTFVDAALGTIPQASFDVELDANDQRDPPALGDLVQITQDCDGSFVFAGEIREIRRRRATNYTIFSVTAFGEARVAGQARLLRTVDGGPLGTVVRSVWAEALPTVDLSLVGTGGPEVEPTVMTYTSVAEFMQTMERQTGWVWSLENNQLRIFDPTDLAAQPAVMLSQTDFARGTLSYNQTLSIVNVARQQAWFRRTVQVSADLYVGARCYESIPTPRDLPSQSEGWEIEEARVIRGEAVDVGVQDQGDPPVYDPRIPWEDEDFETPDPSAGTALEDVEVRVGTDQIDFDPALKWNPLPLVAITYRKLVWVELTDPVSIAEYGRREGSALPHDGEAGVPEARSRLRKHLESFAYPQINLVGEVLRADLRPGMVIQANLPDLFGERTYMIRRVRRAVVGTELEVQIEAETQGIQPLSASAPPVVLSPTRNPTAEVVRRLENIERGPLNPRTPSGALAADVGPIGEDNEIAVTPVVWAASVFFQSIPSEESVTTPWGSWQSLVEYESLVQAQVDVAWADWGAVLNVAVTPTEFGDSATAWGTWTASVQGESVTQAIVETTWPAWDSEFELEVDVIALVSTGPITWRATCEAATLVSAQVDADWSAWGADATSSSFVLAQVDVTWSAWSAQATDTPVPVQQVELAWPLWSAQVTGTVLEEANVQTVWAPWVNETEGTNSMGMQITLNDVVLPPDN